MAAAQTQQQSNQPSTPGVTLDFNTFQPLDSPGNNAQPVGLDFRTFQPVGSPVSRFMGSLKERLQSPLSAGPIGAGGVQQTSDGLPAKLSYEQLTDPQQVEKTRQYIQQNGTGPTLWDQQKQAIKDAFSETLDTISHPSQLLKILPGWDEVKDALTPKEVEQVKRGDYAGAAGTGLVDLVNLYNATLNPEAVTKAAGNAGAATVRGAAKVANTVLDKAPTQALAAAGTGVGAALGGTAAGSVGAGVGAAIGGGTGAAIARSLPKLHVPGEDFGLEAEQPAYDAARYEARATATKARQQASEDLRNIPSENATANTAESQTATPTPANRQDYLDQIAAKRQSLGLTKQPAAGPVEEAGQLQSSLPSEDDVARGIGYKNAMQAQQRLGPDVWRKTYQKVAANDLAGRQVASASEVPTVERPAVPLSDLRYSVNQAAPTASVSDVIDSAIPPSGASKALNMKTKAEVDFYVQKGDVDSAKAAIQKAANSISPTPGSLADTQDDAAVRQQMQADLSNQWSRGRLVEGREQAAGNSADRTKVSGERAQGEQFAQRWSRYPLPEADLETNKMVGYDPHQLPQPYRADPADRDLQPWGGLPSDHDLTALLQRSVNVAKKAREVQTAK